MTRRRTLRDSDILGDVIGQRLIDVTDGPEDDSLDEEGNYYVFFHFGNGYTVKMKVDEIEGFEVLAPGGGA